MGKSGERLLVLGKRDDSFCDRAVEHVRLHFVDPEIRLARRGDLWPADLDDWRGDYIISYLFPFIVPKWLLNRAGRAAINFHPGPPEYPGIGCTNFALYHGETGYGVTCHHMAAKVDTGPIVGVRRFEIRPDDTVLSLTSRCYDHIFELFLEMVALIADDRPLPKSDEMWTRPPFKRRELDQLCRITPDMTPEEVSRRIRAVKFPGQPGAYMELHGHRFIHSGDQVESTNRVSRP